MPLDLEPVLDLQPVEGLDLQEIPASIPDRAANAGKAFAQGVTTSVGQSISGVARTADTIKEGQLGEALTAPTATTPTRRSFVRSMDDPRYMSALLEAGDDPALLLQAQSIFGPMARQNKQEAAGLAQQKRLDMDSPLYQFGKGVVEAGREIYPTDPALDQTPESKLARSLGSTLPSVGLGLVPIVGLPAAVSQYALSQSEDMAQEAIDANRPDLAMQSATAGLFIGALSEATLGASARLKSLLKNPTRIKALEGWAQANPIKARALIIGAREAAQEGVEQGMQNVTASDVVGYDPERPWHRQVLESMALGGAGGLIFGGGGALVTGAGRKAKTAQPDQDEAEALQEFNAALDAFQAEPEAPTRVTELQTPPPAVETRAGETVLLPTFEAERLTPEQQMAREAANAMAELRALKAQRATEAAAAPPSPGGEGRGEGGPQTTSAAEPRPAQTIEAPVSPATQSPAANVRKGTEMPAEAGATPAPETTVQPTAPVQLETPNPKPQTPPAPTRRRPSLGQRPDGVPDVLDAIADLGGIRAPGAQKGTAEYDGYAAAFNEGGPSAVLRGGSQRPDLLLRGLQEHGFRFETIDEMYDAVSRANAARDALTQQIKQQRTVRPEMVDRVQKLYDAAVAGQPVTQTELGELDSRLTERERKMLAQPLKELGTMADVAPAADELSPIEAAKADVRQAWGDLQTLGIVQDPKRDAEKAFALYKALFKLATAYAKKGMKTAAEFAAKTGLKLDAIVQAAWEDAVAGKAKPNASALDVAAVTDLTDNLRQHKFSQRIAPDLAPQLAAASAGNVHAVKPMALTAAEAYAHVTERGLVQAAQDVKDEGNELTLDQRVAIAQAVITQSNHAFAQTGDQASFDAALDMILFTDERLGLETGRGLNAFKLWNRLSPDGYVREYVRTVNKSARRLGIPATIDKDLAKRIRAAAQAALAKPAGFQQDEALIDVMAMIARAKGIPKMDVAVALWYANILSGYPSWLRNAAGNVGFLFAEAATHAATRPQHIPAVLAGLYNGFLEGVPQAVNVLRTGKQTGPRVGKVVESPRVLELVKFKGLAYPLNAWKYVFRIMAATDMVAFSSAQEMHARFLARELVRTGQADGQTYSQLLATASVQRAAAIQQSADEGLSGINYRRRIAEILQQQRPESVTAPSAAAALYATFNQPPRGVLGAVANHISQLSQQFAPLRTVTPFTQIVANVFNNTLDYTPWGYRRLFPSVFLKDRADQKLNYLPEDAAPVDYQLQAARATLGTVGLAALWALSQSFGDEDDHWFDVSGNGPSNPVEREGLKETGWRPYSVKLGGRWTSYQQAPIAPGLAWIGFLRDAQRTKKWLNMDDWSRFAYAGKAVAPALLSQSFVSGLRDFLQDLSDDSADPNGPKFRWASRTASTVVPAAVKAVDKAVDPTIYDSGRFPQALLRDIPYARSQLLKPALNALGEPIRPPGTFSSLANPDPLWALLAEKQSLPGKPSTSTMVGDRPITPEEYYDLIRVRGQWLGQQLRRPEMMAIMERLPAERVQQYVERYSDAATKVARAKLKLRPATPAR